VPVVDATHGSAISGLKLKRELPLEIGNYGSENKVIPFPSPFCNFPICVDRKSSNTPPTERVALGSPPEEAFSAEPLHMFTLSDIRCPSRSSMSRCRHNQKINTRGKTFLLSHHPPYCRAQEEASLDFGQSAIVSTAA